VKESFNIQELLHHKSKCPETKPMHPSLLLESFPKRPRRQSEASQFGGTHKYKTNKLPCFMDMNQMGFTRNYYYY
jgi:hypothetical protein